MIRRALRLAAILLPVLASTAGAEPASRPAILDPDRIPGLSAAARADYLRFLLQPTPRAFALSSDGAWGWAAAVGNEATATEARAIENCRHWGGQSCRLLVRDLTLLDPAIEPPTPPGGALAGGSGWSVVADPRFLWQGPGAARGVYVWAHGRAAGGQDSRGIEPQPHARAFNNAGYDVVRLDRDPATDETQAGAAWMRQALAELRSRGYARVVAAGQSRGAWNALQALDRPGLADAVIAIAPAAHGPTGSPAHAWALDDLRRVVAAAQSPVARVAVANFAKDPFDPDPAQRAAIFGALQGRVGALLFIDRPAGMEGHGAGGDWRFTLRYASCLLDFAEGRVEGC